MHSSGSFSCRVYNTWDLAALILLFVIIYIAGMQVILAFPLILHD